MPYRRNYHANESEGQKRSKTIRAQRSVESSSSTLAVSHPLSAVPARYLSRLP